MKAGIITFHNALNYGALLQAYALQTAIEKLGCDAKVLNYYNPRVATKLVKPDLHCYHNPLNYQRDLKTYWINLTRREKMETFAHSYIHLTERVSSDEIEKLAKEFDVIFTGSDQVWNDKITNRDDRYYLDFVPKTMSCSYAASIGSDEVPEQELPRVKKLLTEFRAISVRETTAQRALKTQIGISSVHVLDPTFLLSDKEYANIVGTDFKDKIINPYIFLYMLIYSESLLESAKKLSKKTGMPVYCVNSSGRPVKGVIDCSTVGIAEWLTLIHNALFVLTNSFHGVAFSINFNKTFNVELPPVRVNANSRILDVLHLYGLEKQILSEGEITEETLINKNCQKQLQDERKKSYNYLNAAIHGEYLPLIQPEELSVLSISWDHCSGCGLCAKICPEEAITMQASNEGFQHPHVQYNQCIQCGKCVYECPYHVAETTSHDTRLGKMYAAYSINTEMVYQSSSGGAFYELAASILSGGGLVYGAAFDNKYSLAHKCVSCLDDIIPLMGSKYVQSNASISFDAIKADLQNRKTVLFVGTPCQVSALRKYCKGIDANLFLVDFICHGVPSPKLLRDHIEYVEKYFRSKVVGYKPRSKVAGWGHHELFTFENGKKDYTHPVSQAYKMIFYQGLGIRSSCFNCPFASFERPGDLTIADYWGIEVKRQDLKRVDGVSMILVNSTKGKNLLKSAKGLQCDETTPDTIIERKQPHLFHPLKVNPMQEQFWRDYLSRGWQGVAEKYAGCDRRSIVMYRVRAVINNNKLLSKLCRRARTNE